MGHVWGKEQKIWFPEPLKNTQIISASLQADRTLKLVKKNAAKYLSKHQVLMAFITKYDPFSFLFLLSGMFGAWFAHSPSL